MEKHIFLLLLLFLIQFSISLAFSNESDQQALLAFQNLITTPNHFLANNWTKNASFCSCFGVTCSSKRQRVVALNLPNLQLQGTISPSSANLSFLRELILENNLFHGGIPYGLGHLPRLRMIDVKNNQLNGSIPTSLFQQRRVQVISLAFNELSGEMWRGPWYVPQLRVLNLTNNCLTGIIPPSVGNATKMMNFSLSYNRINGNIPKEVGNLSQLAFLSLRDNQLTGSIPATLFNISSLLVLSLSFNSLSSPLLLDKGNIVSNLYFLSISYNQISGCIPSNICQLTQLKDLSISFNNITGDIPRNIGCLSKLKKFYIGDNPIKGAIPTSLRNISTLQNLFCFNNCMVGQIPSELGKLSKLRALIFAKNSNLFGRIPEAIFNISSLEIIGFSFNNLSGKIPTTAGLHLPNLKELYVGHNPLEGEIPLFITNASKLEILSLENNSLTGTIPTNLGNLRELRDLFLHGTNEPRERELRFFNSLADCWMLRYISVFVSATLLLLVIGFLCSRFDDDQYRKLMNNIPDDHSNVDTSTTIKMINMSKGRPGDPPILAYWIFGFRGENKRMLRLLKAVYHPRNQYLLHLLDGDGDEERMELAVSVESEQVFRAFGNVNVVGKSYAVEESGASALSAMLHASALLLRISPLWDWFFTLSSSDYPLFTQDGTIPTNLGNLRELRDLFLHGTNEPRERELRFFNSLADCWMLRYISVGSNPLNGVLPNSIGNLSSTIENFYIGDAHINVPIPTSIGNMSGLTALILRGNKLSGSIPSEIGKLKQLQGLYLQNNKLQGHIPEAVCHLSNLDILGNELSELIPECLGNLSMLQKLYLGSNKFSSKFPLCLWKMSGLLLLDVSQNCIEGEVPSDVGGLKAIVELYLFNNHFSGMIPTRLRELQNLQSLYLSNNSFFGQIPLSFANLISLEYLDLSLNALSGTIPKSLEKLLSLKSINVSFNGFEGELPTGGVFANSTLQSFLGNKGLCGVHILDIPACASTSPGKQSRLKEVLLKIVTPVVILSFLIFLLFSIWIMKRRKKGNSKDVEQVPEIGTHQLISYHEIQRATNNFDDESNLIGEGSSGSVYKGTLFEMLHRNLVSVITTCSSDYIRAFVLRYMPNGSLENWLYEEDRHLNLHQRVTIMLDAAMAVEYLHHGHVTPIVHCDLKPANILLDEDMVPHVFGISKILAISKSMAYTETLGTLGYIAPEYGSEGIVSASGDVYSYSIILMEVLTRRRPTDEEICNENLELRKWITQSFSGKLGLDCTMEIPGSRISMKEVVKRLNKINNTFLET
ncbi:hypothetical protein R3W88_011239 [Solanum pinnatisectum]|uniref:non-specific serine/threonine protein kinase n=1 Tax=Solanum pinnatisectum TaxID=50273 RepID=A0AAV9L5Z1_9SOLN|nr:hypothetical protein R3W88_011239 [Solanum pinnatisectum]